jgi:putative membrane protein
VTHIAPAASLTDGEWHRLHPATPLLKGGIALVAIIGFMVYTLRDAFLGTLFGGPGDDEDPVSWLLGHTAFWVIALGIIGVLLLLVAGFYVSWRMHTFRITDELVEVRSGILFRTHRKGRLDRIQGINIERPFIPRLFGAAKLEVNVAGQDANVQLDYLGSAAADALRREILRLASGTQAAAAPTAVAAGGGTASVNSVVEQRLHELLAPELDPSEAPIESVVSISIGRVIGSLLLSGFTLSVVVGAAVVIVGTSVTGEGFFLWAVIPGLIAGASYYWSRFTRSLRYTIAGTPDGIRVGYGLLSTANDTLPPGRIHSVQVSQPLLWRIPGWWEIKVNRATKSTTVDGSAQKNTTILPVGDLADAMRVLTLVLPGLSSDEARGLLQRGIESKGGDDGFTTSPRRAAVLRWFSWRRNGFAMVDDAVLLRKGAIWRELVVVPLARMQSVTLEDGPIYRRLRLGSVRVHTVAGPITPALGALDRADAARFFDAVAEAAVRSGTADTSHHWRAHEVPTADGA